MAVFARPDWGAGPHRAPSIRTPVSRLFFHHSVTPQWVGAHAARALRQIALARGFLDVSYNWGGDRAGNEIELRGWGRQGAHTRGYNSTSHAVVAIGNFETGPLPQAMVNALVRITRRHAGVGPRRITHPHSAVAATACPGRYGRGRIPAINAAAAGSPSPPPQLPPSGGFLMSLSASEQREILSAARATRTRVNNLPTGLEVIAGLIWAGDNVTRDIVRGEVKGIPTGKQWETVFLHLLREGLKEGGHAADELKARVREVINE